MSPGNPHARRHVQHQNGSSAPESAMSRFDRIAAVTAVLALILAGPATEVVSAQGPGGPAPVRTTEARELDLVRSVRLTGSVESRRSSVVASEVEGLVQQLAAREGDRVQKGAPLVRLRRDNTALRLEAVQGQLKEAEARQRLALASLERSEGLSDEMIISQQQLDDAVSEYEAWQGRVAQLQADVSRLEDDLARTTVRAPFSGVVVEEHIAEGEWLSAGGAVVELVDFEDLEVTVDVPESYFAGVRVGGTAPVRIESLAGMEVEGSVRAIVPRASTQARAFPAKISITNTEGRIGVGMLATVELPVGEPVASVVVPKDAVVSQGNLRVVLRVGAENRVERVVVNAGSAQGGWVAVEGDIVAGDQVITRGNERVFPGQEVAPEPLDYDEP